MGTYIVEKMLEGIADKIGCLPKVLIESIEKWNAMAEEEAMSGKPLPPGLMGMPGMPKNKILNSTLSSADASANPPRAASSPTRISK